MDFISSLIIFLLPIVWPDNHMKEPLFTMYTSDGILEYDQEIGSYCRFVQGSGS